jgi:hypothetical protein
MLLGYEDCYALILYRGKVEAARVKKERGIGFSFHIGNKMPIIVEDYERHLGLYTYTEDDHVEAVHVISTAPQAHFLLAPESIPLPDQSAIDTEIDEVLRAIDEGRKFAERGHYIRLLLSKENRYSLVHPFITVSPTLTEGIAFAIRRLDEWEADIDLRGNSTIHHSRNIKI